MAACDGHWHPHRTAAGAAIAQLCRDPAVNPQLWTELLAMPTKACMRPTASGTAEQSMLPPMHRCADAAPSWPLSLLPQHQAAPMVLVMQVCQLPIETVAKVCDAATAVGLVTSYDVPQGAPPGGQSTPPPPQPASIAIASAGREGIRYDWAGIVVIVVGLHRAARDRRFLGATIAALSLAARARHTHSQSTKRRPTGRRAENR